MIFWSMSRRLLVACCLTTLTGCVEYRFDQRVGLDRLSYQKSHQDPQLGPRGKLWLKDSGAARIYVGEDFYRQRHLTIGAGMIYYLSETSSLELGYRSKVWEEPIPRELYDIDPWDETKNFFFIGGRINW